MKHWGPPAALAIGVFLIDYSPSVGHFIAEVAGWLFLLSAIAVLSFGLIPVIVLFRRRMLLAAWGLALGLLLVGAVTMHPHSAAKIVQTLPDASDD